MRMRVWDAFCGVGGVSCGFSQHAGVEVIGGIDSDDKMLRSWASNTGGRAICARIGSDSDAIPLPEAAEDVFVHLSPPCTALSKARAGSASIAELKGGIKLVEWSLDLVVQKGYVNFSLENVSTTTTRAIAQRYKDLHPTIFDFGTFDCADFFVPQSRSRLIISTPATIKLLRETPVTRISVAEAFAQAEHPLPATHLKSNTNNRDGTACTRSVHQQSFVTTASHPLMWSDHAGQSLRCCTVAETAVLMGFPPSWKLPAGSRLGIHALGNAVPPPMANAIMHCALEAARLRAIHGAGAASPPSPPPILSGDASSSSAVDASSSSAADSPRSGGKRSRSVSYSEYSALKRRVEALEARERM